MHVDALNSPESEAGVTLLWVSGEVAREATESERKGIGPQY
jgi:hypothetical protein